MEKNFYYERSFNKHFYPFFCHNPNSPFFLKPKDEYISHRDIYFEKIKYFTKKYANPFEFNKYISDEDWDFSYPNDIKEKNEDNTQEISYKIFEKYNFNFNFKCVNKLFYMQIPRNLKSFEYKNGFPNSKELRNINLKTIFGLNILISMPLNEKVKNLITIYIKKLQMDETYFKYKYVFFYICELLDPDDERYIGTVFKYNSPTITIIERDIFLYNL